MAGLATVQVAFDFALFLLAGVERAARGFAGGLQIGHGLALGGDAALGRGEYLLLALQHGHAAGGIGGCGGVLGQGRVALFRERDLLLFGLAQTAGRIGGRAAQALGLLAGRGHGGLRL